jgi:hypothetical protein
LKEGEEWRVSVGGVEDEWKMNGSGRGVVEEVKVRKSKVE